MTSKERLTRCYFGQEIDRPGVYSRTGFPKNDPSYDKLKAYLWEYSDCKAGWSIANILTPYPTDVERRGYSAEYRQTITTLHTPAGDLTEIFFEGVNDKPGFCRKHFISEPKDIETYLSLPLPEVRGDTAGFFEAERNMDDRGIVEILLGSNPGGTAAELMDSENFAMFSITDRELLHVLCEREMKIKKMAIEFLLANRVGPFFSMLGEEYIVPPLHRSKDFYDFNVRYDKEILDLIHNGGGRVHIHCHGPLKTVLNGFIDMGADVVHPIEPPPMGNITAAEAKNILRGKVCIEGNIQISNMYEATPEQIASETRALIQDAFDDRKGLIVCPTASPYIPHAGLVCFDQYKAMVDTVLDFGKTKLPGA